MLLDIILKLCNIELLVFIILHLFRQFLLFFFTNIWTIIYTSVHVIISWIEDTKVCDYFMALLDMKSLWAYLWQFSRNMWDSLTKTSAGVAGCKECEAAATGCRSGCSSAPVTVERDRDFLWIRTKMPVCIWPETCLLGCSTALHEHLVSF